MKPGMQGGGANMDTQNLFTADPNKIDLINNLSQIKLLQISEHFELIPGQEVDLDQFVKIMQTVLRDSELSDRVDFISELVDIFYRIRRDSVQTIRFEDITTYLIDHEIAFDSDRKTSGGLNASNSSGMNMEYEESKTIKDTTPHNNYIEKLHYFPEIDKLVLYEQNMKVLRIYDAGGQMKHEHNIDTKSVILAVEFISDRTHICVSLSDRTFMFYDAAVKPKKTEEAYKCTRKFNLRFIQKNLCYVKRKKVLFSSQTDCTVNSWNIDEIWNNPEFEHHDIETAKKKKMMEQDELKKGGKAEESQSGEVDYLHYLTDSTPWFISKSSFCTCIVDLPNIDHIAFGTNYQVIELWELRNEAPPDDKKKKPPKESIAQKQKNAAKDMTAKLKSLKRLSGHTKAIREIAYSKKFKNLISVGFDFQVLVWNPYQQNSIMKLDEHEHPLVGVNCPNQLDCFLTCDMKGVICVWNIKDYSLMQKLPVQGF